MRRGNQLSLKLGLFLVSPMISLIATICNYPSRFSRLFLLLFCVWFGISFVPASRGLDSYVHYQKFLLFYDGGWEYFMAWMNDVLSFKRDPELYLPVSYFLLSRLTDSMQAFFAMHGLVFGYFYISSINLIYSKLPSTKNVMIIVLGLFFILLFPINQINAVRWYTAMWVFIYGFIRVLYGDKKGLFFCLGAGLVHFSLYLPALVLVVFHLLKRRNRLYFSLLVFSFFLRFQSVQYIAAKRTTIGIESIDNRADSYTNEGVAELRQEHLSQTNWYVTLRYRLIDWFFFAIMVLHLIFFKRFVLDDIQQTLFSFILLWSSIVNTLYEVPSLGGRMKFVLWILLSIYFLRLFKFNPEIKFNPLPLVGFGIIFLYALVDFRGYSDNVNAQLVLGNPLFAFFSEGGISVRELVFFWE